MRAHGFHVLNYFNVTEFGENMQDTAIPAARADDPALWKDPVAFLKLRLSDAYLKPPILTCYNAWVTDVGDPAYRQFMLDQAKRHIALLPDTDGICVDRNDWLRLDNPTGDDGVSWVDGNPARSLYRSWIAFMDELGPLMHSADKVIFANTMTMRLELTRQLDGIYNEFGNNPGALNASALMGIRKPVLGWTTNETLREPDPDSFFQRHLYLGVYPTAPYPFNHHCITPEPAADGFYMDYGPLLDARRGKRWVLTARCVNTVTPGLGVNLFEVPGGYALPVTFGGKAASARVRLRNCPGLDRVKCEALHPGAAGSVPVPANFKDEELELQVPLKRGCAMVRLTNSSWSGPVDFGKGTGHNHDDGFRATRWAFRSTLARARACRARPEAWPRCCYMAAPRWRLRLQPMVEWSVDRWTKPLRDGLRSCSWTTIPPAAQASWPSIPTPSGCERRRIASPTSPSPGMRSTSTMT